VCCVGLSLLVDSVLFWRFYSGVLMIAFRLFLSRIASLQLVNVATWPHTSIPKVSVGETRERNVSVERITLAREIMEHLTDSEETNMRSKW